MFFEFCKVTSPSPNYSKLSRKDFFSIGAKCLRQNIGNVGTAAARGSRAALNYSVIAPRLASATAATKRRLRASQIGMHYRDEDLDRLDAQLKALPQDQLPMTVSELNVYMTGILVSKSLIPPSERLPGLNDPCPCGSGRKYKACCGRN